MGARTVAALAGYLLGSLSFARLVAHRVKPDADLERTAVPLTTGETFTSTTVSATAVRIALGRRYGVLTGVLDMLKVAIPVFAARRLRPDDSTYVVVAAAGLVGHDLPVYHRFRGGRGESPIFGALLVVDPVGVLVTNLAGMGAGFVAGSLLVLRWAGMILMIPWFWLVRRNRPMALYMTFADLVYVAAMRGEFAQYVRMRRSGTAPTQEELAAEYAMGTGLGRAFDRYSLRVLAGRWLAGRRQARSSDRHRGSPDAGADGAAAT